MDIYELTKLNEIKEYIGEIKDILEINTIETEQKAINKTLLIIKDEINFSKNIEQRYDKVVILEHLYERIVNELL